MANEGVSVISHSLSWRWLTNGDGTVPTYTSSVKTVADIATRAAELGEHVTGNGVVWVNAAGNHALTTWYSDTYAISQHLIDFDNSSAIDKCNTFRLSVGETIKLHLRWDGVYLGTNDDLAIALYKGTDTNGQFLVRSRPSQFGNYSYPIDWLEYTVPSGTSSTKYCVSISGLPDEEVAPGWVQLSTYILPNLNISFEHSTARSVGEPADGRSANLLAIGAADIRFVSPRLTSYSSRGPAVQEANR